MNIKRMNSYLLIIMFSLESCILSGCWDKMEIDKRIFISTIGVDIGKDISDTKETSKVSYSDPFQERPLERLNITYGYPDVSELSPGSGGKAKEQFIKTDAYSMEDGVYKATGKSSRSLDVGQTKLLLFSNDLFGYPDVVKEIIDYAQRQPRLNRKMMVAVVEGKAEDYMKYKPSTEKSVQAYITGLMESSTVNATILPVTLDEFLKLLGENGNAILPRISIDKDRKELSLSGVAVIKAYTLKGVLNPVETSDLEMLRGKIKGGKKVIFIENHPLDYRIEGIKRKLSLQRQKDKLIFYINLSLEGKIRDFTVDSELLSKYKLDAIQDNFNSSLSEECERVVQITQKNLGVDPMGLREYVEKYHPSIWNEVKGNWEEAYKNADVNVNVNTRIRRIGVVK